MANASVVFLTGEKDKRKIKKLNARIYLIRVERSNSMKLKGKIKELTALTSAICMLSVPNTTVLAATGTKINSVPLSIESEIEAWDTDSDVTVSTSSSEFDIDDVVITNEPSDEWDDGDKPKFKITLYADDDYYFASGFLYGLTCGYSLEKCAKIGSILSGNVIQTIGTTISGERWDEIKLNINRILAE